jgi:hypothetical protein
MKRVPIRQALINAVEQSEEQLGRYMNQMLKWAKYIEKEIGSLNGYPVKSKAIIVSGSIVDLPDDCYEVIAVLRGNWEDVTNAHYRKLGNIPIQIDDRTEEISYVWIPLNASLIYNHYWEEVAGKLQLINEFNGQELTIVYQYIETDENGFWIVNESHIDAITKFIIYKFAMKYRWRLFKSEKFMRPGYREMVLDLERDYNIAVRHARAQDGKWSEYERKQM